jgi:hypothetical protein
MAAAVARRHRAMTGGPRATAPGLVGTQELALREVRLQHPKTLEIVMVEAVALHSAPHHPLVLSDLDFW